MKKLFEDLSIIVGSILIGVPIGLIVGLICWFKFPYQVYFEARKKLALRRIDEAEQYLRQHGKEDVVEDIWEKHIQRMEQKKSYDN